MSKLFYNSLSFLLVFVFFLFGHNQIVFGALSLPTCNGTNSETVTYVSNDCKWYADKGWACTNSFKTVNYTCGGSSCGYTRLDSCTCKNGGFTGYCTTSCSSGGYSEVGCSICWSVDGGWSSWSACSNCISRRTCTNPAPSCGGAACVGSSTMTCGTTSGVCGSTLNTCTVGTVTGITTEPFSGGINNVWYCNGSCGGTVAKCTSLLCSAVNGINTMCTGDRLCVNGITASNVRDDGADYIWDCIGTSGSCNGTDGTSQLGCRYTMAHDPWFQTVNGGVLGKSTITNFVPTTCGTSTNGCVEATAIDGLVAAPIINGFDNVDYSSPNNWYTNTNTVNQIDFFGKYKNITGVGTTLIEGDLSDSNIINNNNGLLLVDGDVTISQNKTTLVGGFSMIVASGDITIDPAVTRFDGILAGNNIDIGGSNATQLTINGSIYGTNQVNITRSYIDKMDNNDSPATVIKFRPDFIFNMPTSMAKNVVEWKWGN